MVRTNTLEAYASALQAELDAWVVMQSSLPESGADGDERWLQWCAAVGCTNTATGRIYAEMRTSGSAAALPSLGNMALPRRTSIGAYGRHAGPGAPQQAREKPSGQRLPSRTLPGSL